MHRQARNEVEVPPRQLFIDGCWVSPVEGGRLDVINPATERIIGSIPAATAQDVDKAVTAAARAFLKGTWSKSTGSDRATVLRAIAQKVTEQKARLAKLETLDMGKPIEEAEWDMDDVSGCFQYYAELAQKLDARQLEVVDVGDENKDFSSAIARQPLGVVAAITPFNYPLLMATWKVAPALAAGCSIVLKPSEAASLTCLELAGLAAEAGLPPGVLNVITGTGASAGVPLSESKVVAKIAFTGSVLTGKCINQAAGQNLVPCTLELGGKSALIVFEDADIENAIEWVMFGIFLNGGQICSATSRLILHQGIADAFYLRLKQRAESIVICNPEVRQCRLGPVVSREQYNKVLRYIQVAKVEGATLLTGGGRPRHMAFGYFVEPTVFINVRPDMHIWRDEVFGPVLAATTFSTEQEAIDLANGTEYGLAAAVISASEQRCKRVAQAMEAGIVWVNCSQPCFVQAPWGGIKASGHGRELGTFSLENFLMVKQITTYTSKSRWDWYPSKL